MCTITWLEMWSSTNTIKGEKDNQMDKKMSVEYMRLIKLHYITCLFWGSARRTPWNKKYYSLIHPFNLLFHFLHPKVHGIAGMNSISIHFIYTTIAWISIQPVFLPFVLRLYESTMTSVGIVISNGWDGRDVLRKGGEEGIISEWIWYRSGYTRIKSYWWATFDGQMEGICKGGYRTRCCSVSDALCVHDTNNAKSSCNASFSMLKRYWAHHLFFSRFS